MRSLPSRWQGPEGAPVVVFANSLGARQGSWREQIERLGTRARSLTFDLPGHAVVEEDPFTFDDIVDATARLLDEQGVRGGLFCGVSLGGAVGVALAARRPELVGRLVAVNAPIRQASPAFWLARADAVERNGLDALADDLPARWFTAGADPDRVSEIVAEFRTIPPEGYAQTCRAIADIELAADAGRVRIPTVIVTGTADLAVPAEHGDEYASVIGAPRGCPSRGRRMSCPSNGRGNSPPCSPEGGTTPVLRLPQCVRCDRIAYRPRSARKGSRRE